MTLEDYSRNSANSWLSTAAEGEGNTVNSEQR